MSSGRFSSSFKRLAFTCTLIVGTGAHAASAFERKGECGEARVTEGTTCADLKVAFDFKGCGYEGAPAPAKNVTCQGETATARGQYGVFKYEITLTKAKAEGAWGTPASWTAAGPLKQWIKKSAAKAAAAVTPTPPPPREPAAVVPAPFTAPHAEVLPAPSPFKFSAFANFGYTTQSPNFDPSEPEARAASGFGLEDAAVYANYDKEKISFIADLAVRRAKTRDQVAGSTSNASSTNNIALGVDRSQLYLRYRATTELAVYAGQFDTIYGVELNDSKDRLFNKTGLIYDQFLPVTHSGVMVEFAKAGAYAKALAANPNNQNSYGTDSSAGQNTEYGGAVGFANDMIHAQVGYLSRPVARKDGVGRGDRALLDAVVGVTHGPFAFDVEYARLSDPAKATLQPADPAAAERAGNGLLLLGSYKIGDFTFGARFERVQGDPAKIKQDEATSWGATVHYRLSPDLELRSEYMDVRYTPVGAESVGGGRFQVSALVTF